MSLDISLMDESGRPKACVSLSASEHWALIQQAQQLQLPLWGRMNDFYADADYREDEVGPLIGETVSLRRSYDGAVLSGKLAEIETPLRTAIEGKKRVCAIAD